MTNITQNVWSLLSHDPSIQKNLQKNLINTRALAKYLIKHYNLKASADSVISAIRRYSANGIFKENTATIREIFSGANISTKNNLACLMIKNQSNIQKYLSEITEVVDFERRETLRMIKGKGSLKIIIDMKNLKKLKDFFSSEEDILIKENLSEIKLLMANVKADETKGVAAKVSNELLSKDINISEIIFCVPEIIIYVDQKDLLKAHESIFQICNV